jgi:RHS repeat-associated protein
MYGVRGIVLPLILVVAAILGFGSGRASAQTPGNFPIECVLTSAGTLYCSSTGSCTAGTQSNGLPGYSCSIAGSTPLAASCSFSNLRVQCTSSSPNSDCTSGWFYSYCRYKPSAYLSASPSSIGGLVPTYMVGTTAWTTPIAITNMNAGASVQFTGISIQKGLADYSIVTSCPSGNPGCSQCAVSSNLAPGNTCYVGVRFTPQSPKQRPGSLIVAASAGSQPIGQLTIGLSGTGTYGVAPATVDDKNAGHGLRVRAAQRLPALMEIVGGAPVSETASVSEPLASAKDDPGGGGDDGDSVPCNDPCTCGWSVDPLDNDFLDDTTLIVDDKRMATNLPGASGAMPNTLPNSGSAANSSSAIALKAAGAPTSLAAMSSRSRPTTAPRVSTTQKATNPLRVGPGINVGAANVAKTQIDHQGVYADPMVFARTYNSLLWHSAAAIAQPFGPGWVSNWDQVLAVSISSSGGSWVYQQVLVPNGDGSSYTFTPSGSGWASSSDITANLTQLVTNGMPAGWVLTKTDGTVRTYDALNRLSTLRTLTGRIYTLSYDSNSRLTSVQNQFGRTLAFGYDSNGRVSTLTDVAGGVTTYAYDGNGRLANVTYPDGRTRGYVYENTTYPDALTGMIDSDGTRIATYAYDSSGRPTSSQLANGVDSTTIAYGTTNVTVSDVNGTTYTKTFSINSNQVQLAGTTTACSGCPTLADSAAYDTLGQLTNYTNPNGIRTYYQYDSLGRPTSVTEAGNTSVSRRTATVWNASLDIPQSVQTPINKTSYFYDTSNRLIQKTVTSGSSSRTIYYSYTANGQLATVDGSRTDLSDVTTYTYDALGNVATVTDPLGHLTRYTSYNALGQPLSITYADGSVETRTYDAMGRVLTDTDAGRTTTNTYNSNGLAATTTTPEGVTTAYTYDANHQLIRVDRASDGHIVYAFNSAGQVTSVNVYDIDSTLARSSTFTYDRNGRRSMMTDLGVGSMTFKYDANGNPVSMTDANGAKTTFTYDALNRVVTVSDPKLESTQIAYDATNRPLTVTDPNGNTTTYSYSGFEDLVGRSSPDTGFSSTTVDPAGNPINIVDARSASAATTFDASNQATRTSYSDGMLVTWSFVTSGGGTGRLASASNGIATQSWMYDASGRKASKSQTVGALTLTLLFARDTLGNLAAITYPSGSVLQLGYANGVVTSLSWNGQVVANDIQYFPFGPPESWLFGDGTEYTRYIDTNGRVSKYLVPGGSQTLTRDSSGQITALTDDATGRRQSMTYDTVQRLTAFSGFTSASATDSRSYKYDANGNRTSASVSGTSYTYSYTPASNRLASVSGGVRTNAYDANGNLVSDGRATYVYGASNTLKQVITTAGTYSYGVDAFGARVSRIDSSGAGSIWVRDDAGHILGEYNAQTGAPIQEFIWLNDTPVAVVGLLPVQCGTPPCRQQGVGYIWTDQLETPRAVTAAGGAKIWEWFSAPFGDTPPNENPYGIGPFTMQLRFPGQYFDAISGMNENGARAYDSAIGRYSQSDPEGLVVGTNTYAYGHNNPLRRADPTGLDDGEFAGECNLPTTPTPPTCNACYRICEWNFDLAMVGCGTVVVVGAAASGLGVAVGALCAVGEIAVNQQCELRCDQNCK